MPLKQKEDKCIPDYKVVVIGDAAVGKTSLIKRWTEGTFQTDYAITIGCSFAAKSLNIDDKPVKLQIWDLAGSILYKHYRRFLYKNALGIVYVFDVAQPESFENLKELRKEAEEEVRNIPSIVIGNKIDLPRKVESQEAEQYSKSLNSPYFETSACQNINIKESFEAIGKLILENRSKN